MMDPKNVQEDFGGLTKSWSVYPGALKLDTCRKCIYSLTYSFVGLSFILTYSFPPFIHPFILLGFFSG